MKANNKKVESLLDKAPNSFITEYSQPEFASSLWSQILIAVTHLLW